MKESKVKSEKYELDFSYVINEPQPDITSG